MKRRRQDLRILLERGQIEYGFSLKARSCRVCPNKKCGASYHVVNIPPKQEGICDVCGAELEQRKDDNEETAANRIEVYNKETKPLIDYYEKAGNIAHIDGTIGLENVFNTIVNILGE